MNEITPEELFKGLLGQGLFSEKLPPVFTSESFCEFYIRKTTEGEKLNESANRSDYVRYESIRNVNVPRSMGVPTPINYAKLCECLRDHWSEIQRYFEDITISHNYKVSRVHIRKRVGKKSLFEMNYRNERDDGFGEDAIVGTNRYKVSADISSCFPSIYTHAIPWAIQGKENAKKTKHDHWSDIIDEKCRNIKYAETSGVLIGPHTSNLISEIVLCKIDQRLMEKGYSFVRFVDDYRCYVKNREDAERFLVELNQCLKEFELSINHKKSEIIKLPETSNTNWILKLNCVDLGDVYTKDGKQVLPLYILKKYLDTAILLCLENNDAAPLTYAIKVISSKVLGLKAISYYCCKLTNLVVCYPYLSMILDEYFYIPFNINHNVIQSISNELFKYGIKRCQYDACSYALFWATKYGFEVEFDENSILSTKDCVLLTMAYFYAKNKGMGTLIKSLKKEANDLKKSFDRYWLFIYETLPASSLPVSYETLKKNGVSFVKPESEW